MSSPPEATATTARKWVSTALSFLLSQWFIIGNVVAVVLAWRWPDVARTGGSESPLDFADSYPARVLRPVWSHRGDLSHHRSHIADSCIVVTSSKLPPTPRYSDHLSSDLPRFYLWATQHHQSGR